MLLKRLYSLKDVLKSDKEGNNIFSSLIEHGRLSYLKQLATKCTRHGIEWQNVKQSNDWGLMDYAAFYNQASIIKWLLSLAPYDFQKECHGESVTSLQRAAHAGSYDVVEVLVKQAPLSYIEWKAEYCGSALYDAAAEGNYDVLVLLLKCTSIEHRNIQCNMFCEITTPLFKACQNGHVDCVRKLLEDSPAEVRECNYGQGTLLHIACRGNIPEMVNVVLKGARPRLGMIPVRGFMSSKSYLPMHYVKNVQVLRALVRDYGLKVTLKSYVEGVCYIILRLQETVIEHTLY
eukprot:TRINITY_DN2013_c0_g1_i3.p1 TRINITY_DN2013_c0_g1~~TRINITY_DN2013_c0_g1_i3.p1  ORF type:complete len:336 (-),score=-1.96 TRINITY_DN2013_c0_g1_i3:431-1300(-)